MVFVVKSRKYGNKTVIIDDEDWPRVSEYTWHYAPEKKGRDAFIFTSVWGGPGGKKKQLKLQRFIMRHIPERTDVGHFDENSLNNKKENLRLYKTYNGQIIKHNGRPVLYNGMDDTPNGRIITRNGRPKLRKEKDV